MNKNTLAPLKYLTDISMQEPCAPSEVLQSVPSGLLVASNRINSG